MKSLMGRWYLLATLAGLTWLGTATTVVAAEERDAPPDPLQRLERRVNEMAEIQKQMMHRLEVQIERRETMPLPPPENIRNPLPPVGAPPMAQLGKELKDTLGLLFLIGVICNILMAIWIFTDIRKRGEGSALFVAMALFAGVPAALIYAVTRLGDRKA